MRSHASVVFGLSMLLAACASAPHEPPPEGAFQDVGIEIFDRDTLSGWRATDSSLWSVSDEAIAAHSSRKEHALKYQHPVEGPIRLHLSIAPLGRGPSDGKMVQLVDAVGRFASVSLDDDVPGTLAIYGDGAPGGRNRRVGGLDVPVEIGKAVAFTIEADGRELRVEHEGRVLTAPFVTTLPVRIQLAVQRTGARFRGLILGLPRSTSSSQTHALLPAAK